MLQQWDLQKRLEQYAKIIFRLHCADYRLLSAVEPRLYKDRFMNRVRELVLGLKDHDWVQVERPTA